MASFLMEACPESVAKISLVEMDFVSTGLGNLAFYFYSYFCTSGDPQ